MKIIRATVAGERDPRVLASFRHPGCESSEETIVKALTGHWQEELLFTLRQSLELFDRPGGLFLATLALLLTGGFSGGAMLARPIYEADEFMRGCKLRRPTPAHKITTTTTPNATPAIGPRIIMNRLK